MSSMQANALLEAALQLKGTGWRVASSSFGGKPAEMEIVMEGGKIGAGRENWGQIFTFHISLRGFGIVESLGA